MEHTTFLKKNLTRKNVNTEVAREVVAREVGRRAGRVQHARQRAGFLGEVEGEAIVGALPPQRAHAVVAVENEEGFTCIPLQKITPRSIPLKHLMIPLYHHVFSF